MGRSFSHPFLYFFRKKKKRVEYAAFDTVLVIGHPVALVFAASRPPVEFLRMRITLEE